MTGLSCNFSNLLAVKPMCCPYILILIHHMHSPSCSGFKIAFLQILLPEDSSRWINFLGFTHICGKTRKGHFMVLRKTMRKGLHTKLKEVYDELRRRMHNPAPDQGAYLRSVVAGHTRNYGVPLNGPSVSVFRKEVCRLLLKVLRRRSHKHNLTWERMERLIVRWIPLSRACHLYPLVCFGVGAQGRSTVR